MEDQFVIELRSDQEKLIQYIRYLESLKYKNEIHKQAILDLTSLAKNVDNACLSLTYSGSGIIG